MIASGDSPVWKVVSPGAIGKSGLGSHERIRAMSETVKSRSVGLNNGKSRLISAINI